MSERSAGAVTWLRSIWILLGAFLGFGATTALIAILIGPGEDVDTNTGWIVLGLVVVAQLTVLVGLRSRWFAKPPSHIAGTVLTGVFLRVAVGELSFLIAFVLFFMNVADVAILLAGFVASIVLIWIFAAPTSANIVLLQDQLELVGGQGDVAGELAATRLATEHPPR